MRGGPLSLLDVFSTSHQVFSELFLGAFPPSPQAFSVGLFCLFLAGATAESGAGTLHKSRRSGAGKKTEITPSCVPQKAICGLFMFRTKQYRSRASGGPGGRGDRKRTGNDLKGSTGENKNAGQGKTKMQGEIKRLGCLFLFSWAISPLFTDFVFVFPGIFSQFLGCGQPRKMGSLKGRLPTFCAKPYLARLHVGHTILSYCFFGFF